MRRLSILLSFLVTVFATVASASPAWSVDKLNGKITYHDGANCFDGVLAGLGFIDPLVTASDQEFLWYLQNFCKPVPESVDAAKSTDVLAVMEGDGFEHGAIALGGTRIFEKSGLGGKYGRFGGIDDQFAKKDISQSMYFPRCAGQCHVDIYQCQDAKTVRSQTLTCSKAAQALGIQDLRSRLNALSLDHNQDVSTNDIDGLLKTVNNRADALTGNEPCVLYIYAQLQSLNWNLWDLYGELTQCANGGVVAGRPCTSAEKQMPPPIWSNSLSDLGSGLKKLEAKVLQFDSSPSTIRFIHLDDPPAAK